MTPKKKYPSDVFLRTQDGEHLTARVGTLFHAVLDNEEGLLHGGPPSTLTAGDVIDGKGRSGLSIVDFGLGGVMSIQGQIKGMKTLEVTSAQNVDIDTTAWGDLQSIAVNLTSRADNDVNRILAGAAVSQLSIFGGGETVITDRHASDGKMNSIRSAELVQTGAAGEYTGVTLQTSALESITLDHTHSRVFVESAAGPRTLSLTLDGVNGVHEDGNSAQFFDVEATGMKVHAIGDASTMGIWALSATTISFDLDTDLLLDNFVGFNATSIRISGRGDFTISTLASPLDATINASRSKGDMTIDLATGQTYIGGSGADIINLRHSDFFSSEIRPGKGASTITLSIAPAHVSLQEHGANKIVAYNAYVTYALDTAPAATSVATSGLNVIEGLGSGDRLVFPNLEPDADVNVSANLAGVSGDVEFAHGIYNARLHTFALNQNGHDALVTYGIPGEFASLVLVGVHDFALPATLSDSGITLH